MKKSVINAVLAASCLGFTSAAAWSVMPRDVLFSSVDQYRRIDSDVNDHGKQVVLQPSSYNNPVVTAGLLVMAIASGATLALNLDDEEKLEEKPSVKPEANQQVATPVIIKNTNLQRTSVARPAVSTPTSIPKPFSRVEPVQFDDEPYADDEAIAVTEYSKGVFTGDIIGEIIKTTLHMLIATKSGAGKSTTLKAILKRLMTEKPEATFNIIDPKTTDWFGLQQTTDIVTYLNQDTPSEQLDAALEAINKTYAKLKARRKAVQKALREGTPIPKFSQHYLILDEWYKVYADIVRLKRVDEFAEPLGEIVSMGRELGIQLILVSISHLCGEIGFSGPARECFSVLAQGRVGENNDVGYAPIVRALKDSYLFQDKNQRVLLEQQLNQAIAMAKKEGDRPVMLITMGIPRIALGPDLKHLDGFRFDSEQEDTEEPMDDAMDELDRILAIGNNVIPFSRTAS